MRDRRATFTAVLALLLLGSTNAYAQTTWIVDDDGQGSAANCDDAAAAFSTVSAAIAAAVDGDTVLVCPGTFVETIDFAGKAIVVRSRNGADSTIIDGDGSNSVVTFAAGEGRASILQGFTIRNGRGGFDTGFGDGGGVRIASSSPTVRGNVIVDNEACIGAGIAVTFGSPLIQANRIERNRQMGCTGGTGGGGILVGGESAAEIRENVIAGNVTGSGGGGISLFAAGTPIIERNIIVDNAACGSGGGIDLSNFSDATIAGNLIARNSACGPGGGIAWLVPFSNRGPVLVNNTIAHNDSPLGSGVHADGFDELTLLINNIIVAADGQTAVYCGDFNDVNPPQFRSNDVVSSGGAAYGGLCTDQTGTSGNLSVDPLFVNPAAGDYHLSAASPLIDAGDNGAPALPDVDRDGDARVIDGDGDGAAVVDIGADEVAGAAGPIPIVIDVQPGNAFNHVNPRSRATLRVAILSTDAFDATSVDPESVRFGPALASAIRTKITDVNHDGLADLLLHFRTDAAGFTCASTLAALEGEVLTGQSIRGTDAIRPLGCKAQSRR